VAKLPYTFTICPPDLPQRVRQAVVVALEEASSPPLVVNWYYLDESLALHQLGKWAGHSEAYAEMEKVSKKRKIGYLYVMPEATVNEWRARLDRWLGDDGYAQKYKKCKGDL